MTDSFLPYGRQWIDSDDAQAVSEASLSDFLTTGPRVDAFEAALAAGARAAHAVAVSSGTAALHVAYHAVGLGPGEELVTTPLTFAATANAALYLGATVRFADVEPDTGNLDPDAARAAIGPKTRLVAPVDFTGHPAEYDAFRALASGNQVSLVADAAHSIGATYRTAPVGTLADATTFSFHPVKTVTTGEGGAVLTDDDRVAERARDFRNHGLTRDPARFGRDEGPWYYEMQALGFNYRITDLQCALGLSQLRRLEAFIARRRRIAQAYQDGLEDIDALERPVVRPHVEPAWHLYVVRVREPNRRRAFFERLRALGLGVQVHYIPVYWHPYYRELGYREGECPIAEDFYARAVSLPMYPAMSDDDVTSAIERIHRAAREVL